MSALPSSTVLIMMSKPEEPPAPRGDRLHHWFACGPLREPARRGDVAFCLCGRPFLVTRVGRGPFARLAWTPADE